MYSVVLLAALSTGADTPACWHLCGCHGGCYGCSGCSGCYGGCYGGYGGCYGCHGGWGGYGGCYGCYGGCYGGCWGGYGGCYGCYGGCYGCYGSTYAPVGTMGYVAVTPAAPVIAQQSAETAPASAAKPAKVVVELPPDAQLFVDDQLMKATSAKRTFRTPSLEPGQTYYYMLRGEVVRDGQTYRQTKRILVRAGEEVQASLTDLESQATARAAIASSR